MSPCIGIIRIRFIGYVLSRQVAAPPLSLQSYTKKSGTANVCAAPDIN